MNSSNSTSDLHSNLAQTYGTTFRLFGNQKFSSDEAQFIQEKLNLKLGPDFITSRSGPGGVRLTYLEGWRAIDLANKTFGFNGWSSSILNFNTDYLDISQDGRVSLGVSCTVRVQLKDGTSHEDIGYGSVENSRSKGAAYEKAKKEAVTDGLKRALKSFGSSMGNCLYDKGYLRQIGKAPTPKPVVLNAEDYLTVDSERTTYKSCKPVKSNQTTPMNSHLSSGVSSSILADTPILTEHELTELEGLADFIDDFELGELTQKSFQTPSKPTTKSGDQFEGNNKRSVVPLVSCSATNSAITLSEKLEKSSYTNILKDQADTSINNISKSRIEMDQPFRTSKVSQYSHSPSVQSHQLPFHTPKKDTKPLTSLVSTKTADCQRQSPPFEKAHHGLNPVASLPFRPNWRSLHPGQSPSSNSEEPESRKRQRGDGKQT